ncbi:hypothetical protein NXW19_08690 [Bacteroides ovatus]|nr:hypothetical protein NXW19_08690 [Bacteroides ovatus]
MKKLLFILFISFVSIGLAHSQFAIRQQVATPRAADSLDISFLFSKERIAGSNDDIRH